MTDISDIPRHCADTSFKKKCDNFVSSYNKKFSLIINSEYSYRFGLTKE